MQPLRIGVLGCASIAKRSVIPAIKALPNRFKLACVASRSQQKADEFATTFNCPSCSSYDELIGSSNVDALYIPLPTGIHSEWISKAIANGKHVYAEKSFASSFIQSSGLVKQAEQRRVALMEGYMFLYHNQQRTVAGLVDAGEIGELRHFHGCFGFPPLPSNNFRYDETLGGGVLMDAAGYPLRAAQYFIGSSLKVLSANLHRHPTSNVSLWGSALLAGHHGIGASIAFGFHNFYQCRYELWGSTGKITVPKAYTCSPIASPVISIESNLETRSIDVDPCDHFQGALEEFFQAIHSESKRQQHYADILRQSMLLDEIKNFSTLSNENA